MTGYTKAHMAGQKTAGLRPLKDDKITLFTVAAFLATSDKLRRNSASLVIVKPRFDTSFSVGNILSPQL